MSVREEFFKNSFLCARPISFEGSSRTAFMEASGNVDNMVSTWPTPFITIPTVMGLLTDPMSACEGPASVEGGGDGVCVNSAGS